MVGAGRFERPTPCAQGMGGAFYPGNISLLFNELTRSFTPPKIACSQFSSVFNTSFASPNPLNIAARWVICRQ
jgi:hypothetical protein